MVSVKLNIMQNVCKPMRYPWDYGFRFQYSGDVGKLWVYDDDNEWGIFFRFLMCPEIFTVFITELSGSCFDGLAMEGEPIYTTLTEPYHLEDLFWEQVMPKLFPGYDVTPFSQHEYHTYRNRVCNNICDRATAISSLFPFNVVHEILRPEIPVWTKYVHDSNRRSFPPANDHEAYMDTYFYDLPKNSGESIELLIEGAYTYRA